MDRQSSRLPSRPAMRRIMVPESILRSILASIQENVPVDVHQWLQYNYHRILESHDDLVVYANPPTSGSCLPPSINELPPASLTTIRPGVAEAVSIPTPAAEKRCRHKHTTPTGKPKPYACHCCGMEFTHVENIKPHWRAQCGSPYVYFCYIDSCDHWFLSKGLLGDHIRHRHQKKPQPRRIEENKHKLENERRAFSCPGCRGCFFRTDKLSALENFLAHLGSKRVSCISGRGDTQDQVRGLLRQPLLRDKLSELRVGENTRIDLDLSAWSHSSHEWNKMILQLELCLGSGQSEARLGLSEFDLNDLVEALIASGRPSDQAKQLTSGNTTLPFDHTSQADDDRRVSQPYDLGSDEAAAQSQKLFGENWATDETALADPEDNLTTPAMYTGTDINEFDFDCVPWADNVAFWDSSAS